MNFDAPVAPASFADDDIIPVAPTPAAQPEPDPIVSADAVLTVTNRVEYSALPRNQTQDVFGLITVQASAEPQPSSSADAADAERQPMDLMCVLDVSGSMRGNKLVQLQDAVRFIIDQATSKDRLSIVAFNDRAGRVIPFRKMDTDGKDSATVATVKLTAGGGTSIARGLDTALSVMEQRRQRNKVSAVLLLTDGQDSSTRGQASSLIARAQRIGCSLYTFGFGADHDAGLLSSFAEQAQTPFTYVEDTEHIRQAFAGTVGGLSSIIAQGVELAISCHVPLKATHTPFAVERRSESEVIVTIPDVFAGERRDVLVELAAPANTCGETVLLDAHVRFTDLRSGCVVQTPPVNMKTTVVEEPQPEDEPDAEVSAQRERVEVTQTLQQASAQSDMGQFEEAQRMLAAADTRIKERKSRTYLSESLSLELTEARSRMQSRIEWESGGRAEVSDATLMHRTQRSMTYMVSSQSRRSSDSKAMYLNRSQTSWISRSMADF
jgi:Mg-chelatase subunit ChlD